MAEGAVRLWERVGLVQRLLLVIGLIVILAAAGAVALSAHHATQDARADLAREFDQQAEILSYALAPAMNTHDPERLSQALSQVRREPSVVRIGFRDVSDSAEYTQTSPVELRAPQWFARWCGTTELEGTQPVFVNDTYHGILTLALTPVLTINRAWERVLRQLGILGWLLGLVTLGVWLVLQSGLRPLGTLAKGSRALSEGDFSVRLPLRGSPELRQSVAGFNRMAAALESLVKELQANNAALAHNEENLRVTLRSIGDGVIVTDASGLVVMLNPVAEDLTGWPEAEARGKPVREVFHIINESTRREVQSPVTEVLRHGVVVGLANHTLLVTRDGEERPIADSGAPIRLRENGEIQGVVLVFRDQTADRDRMRALEERERRYASLAQAAPVGILRMDKQSRVVFCNDRLGEIVGMSKEAIAREGVAWVSNHTHPEDRPRVDAAFRAAARSGEGVKLLFRSILPDGSVAWVKVVMAPERDGEGQIEGFVLIVADVTDDQRHLERIDHLAKLYATLSQINHAIVHSEDQEALFQEVCRVAVASGGVSTAWIFNADQTGNRLILGAMAGAWVTDELRQRLQTIDLDPAAPGGRTLTAQAAREERRLFSNDSSANFEAAGLSSGMPGQGSGSLAAVPIKQDGRTVAVLGLLAMETGYFNPDMLALIDEIGEDISYALQNLEREQQRRAAEERLRNQEERLRLALEASGLGCYELDVTNDRVLLDGVYARMLGLEPQAQEMPIKTYLDYCFPTPEQRQIVREALSARKDGRFSAEQKFLRPDGKLIWIQRRGAVVAQQPDGAPLRILATAADMTARHDMEEHLRMMAMVFENSRDAVIITDADANIVMVNPAFSQVTGYTPAEVMGKNPRILGSGRQNQTYYRTLWRNLRENGFWQGELWNQRKNGEQYPSLSAISAVRQADGTLTHYVGLSRDITQQKESEARITKLAYRDALTDLPNRLLLRDRADLGLASAHRDGHTMALLFVDLDHFKNINDSLGHAIGDRLLVEVARRMRAALREMDTVGRLGGDEFLLLLPDADADAAAHVAQKLLTEVAKPVRIDAHTLTVTPSVGISLFPKDGRSFDELMKSADTAMYRAKERGRNTYHFADAEMNQAVFQRLVLESSLRRAIEGGELVLFYQPQYTVTDKCLIGVEALLRWKQPELGFVSPGQFIPVAEESGLIEPIGAWVLGEVCRQVVRWRNQGVCAGRVGVNFSARQFAAPNLIQVVDQALAASGLTGDCLEAEITESLLVGDLDSVLEVLHAFKARGIHVAVDDFGTGYSSLSYLKRFPIDRLKIDQSFIRDLESDPDDRAIATAVVTLGHSLGMRVIAEGVETTEQLAILQEIGCDEAQGFHLGRPMPAPELSRLLSPLEIPA